MVERLKALLDEYGPIVAVIYFTVFFLTWGGFALAIRMGFAPDGAAGETGLWVAAYLATKLTQPIRIAATLALAPIARAVQKRVWPSSVKTPPTAPPAAPPAA